MPFIKTNCPTCGKVAEVSKSFSNNLKTYHLLKCMHVISDEHLVTSDPSLVTSIEGKKLYQFQCDSVRFIEQSSGRTLIAHEMGLGKTVIVLATFALHPEMLPAVYIVKSSLKIQWQYQIMSWVSASESDDDIAFAQIIDTSKDKMIPGCDHYIYSFDILRRFNGSLHDAFEKRGVKTIVIDECQQIKAVDSQRTKAVRELCKGVPNIIGLSGTPIKNNAGEYFSILNILHPERYSNYSRYLYNECDSYWTGYGYKTGGLKDPKRFMEKTKDFIIRKERKEVMPELPMIDRRFQFEALGEEVEEAYLATFKAFRDDYYSGGNGSSAFEREGNTLAYLSKMRHLTGLSKIEPCVDFVDEFLQSTDRKLTIFVHHKDVHDILARKLSKMVRDLDEKDPRNAVLSLTAELSSEQRGSVVDRFMEDNGPRILVASTLASGEGLNLQKCSDCIILERQWNPANEEQAEGRFIRIGQLAQSVTSTYFVAVGTVDEFFAKLVEQKREIVGKTLGGESIKWDQSSLMKELAATLAVQGGRAWGL